jgi:hypothetical protein
LSLAHFPPQGFPTVRLTRTVFLLDPENAACPKLRRKKEEIMNQLLKDFVQDAMNQLFGWNTPRQGRLILTHHAFLKMREYNLDTKTLEDAFRFGDSVSEEKIIRVYPGYLVGLIYKPEDTQLFKGKDHDTRFVIITCWKGVRP